MKAQAKKQNRTGPNIKLFRDVGQSPVIHWSQRYLTFILG